MKEYLAYQDTVDDLLLWRQGFARTFLLVEGATDQRLFKRFTDTSRCKLRECHGKENVLSVLSLLEIRGFDGVVAIVDADFMLLEQVELPSNDLFITDEHDIEMMFLRSKLLEQYLDVHGSDDKLVRFWGENEQDVRRLLLNLGRHVGYIRWLSLRERFEFRFEGLDYEKFISRDKLELNVTKLIKTIKDHSRTAHIADNELLSKLNALISETHDLWHVCCGHDLIYILALGLKKALGTHDARECTPEDIEQTFRVGFSIEHFRATRLYQSLADWELHHPEFKLLA